MRKGYLVNPGLFISETLSMNNPYFRPGEVLTEEPG
jgi:hypothetical protein